MTFTRPPIRASRGLRTLSAFSIAAAFLLSTPARAAAQEYSGVVVFGDSLSDSGNAFALRGVANTPPDYALDPFLVPGAPYARGGHHFQDGATWVEQLARSLRVSGSAGPAFQSSSAVARNFAVGGARAREDGINVNLPAQVASYLERAGGTASPTALYVIAIGSNDVRDALVAYSRGQNGGPILAAALGSIAQTIASLSAAGARTFLVWNVPNIGLTPALRMAGPAASQLATTLSVGFNAQLAAILGQLAAGLPAARIVSFDAFGLLTSIVNDPGAYGMSNVTSACVTPYEPPFTCGQPDEFLFWDGIHPTRATHAIIAQQVIGLLR
jgi:phospholipase/lecithinase/hemolysin